jgi:hypothetical protein
MPLPLPQFPSPVAAAAAPKAVGAILAAGALAVALGGCRFDAMKLELIRQGHAATVDCLQAERAITGGDELRCEEWDYVRANYLRPEG